MLQNRLFLSLLIFISPFLISAAQSQSPHETFSKRTIQSFEVTSVPDLIFLEDGKHMQIHLGSDMEIPSPDTFTVVSFGDTIHYAGQNYFLIADLVPATYNMQLAYFSESGKRMYHPGLPDALSFRVVVREPLIRNDAVVLGLLLLILATIFKTASMKRFQRFYTFVPKLLLCYFIPSILNSFGVISGELSGLYYVSSHYLLPASLILLCLSIDLKGVLRLGPKALLMFLSGTLGIVIGGPIAVMLVGTFAPDIVGGEGAEEVWKGLATVAGSWIGGGANQAAMKEIFQPSERLFAAVIAVDVIIANIWMAFLLFGAGMSALIDRQLKANNSAIEELRVKMEGFALSSARVTTFSDLMIILAIGFGGTAIAHFAADWVVPSLAAIRPVLERVGLSSLIMPFFWLVVVATTIGLILSFTKFRHYEGFGASKMGSAFLYILVATIGMKMDLTAVADNLGLYLVGLIWMLVHVIILLSVAKIIKAPFFFVAVGSQANIGGAASAPIVASAFSPALAPVGVLLGVLGYALGTYGAIISAFLMSYVSP
jgi:uncharacterized membrane protein